ARVAVLDAAALIRARSPKNAPVVAARQCLRGGFLCFGDVARAMGIDIPAEPDPSAGISISYEEFLEAVARMQKVDFPTDREPENAGPDFVGWRGNHEQTPAAPTHAPAAAPALWSAPHPHPRPPTP